jgi:hypothetical protein
MASPSLTESDPMSGLENALTVADWRLSTAVMAVYYYWLDKILS